MNAKTILSSLLVVAFSGAVVMSCAQPRYNKKAIQFNDWCKDNRISLEASITVDAMKSAVGTDSCLDAGQALSTISKLDLSNKNITDTRPIAIFDNIEELDLSNNDKLAYVWPLQKLKNLKVLNLSNNSSLKSFKGLEKISTLIRLNLDNSGLSADTNIPGNSKLKIIPSNYSSIIARRGKADTVKDKDAAKAKTALKNRVDKVISQEKQKIALEDQNK